jgi:hypothetical protein
VGDVEEEDVEVFIQPPRHVLPPKRRHPRELLFTFYGLGDRFADCVQRWHAGRERYGPTFDLFFALGSMSLFLEHQFLSLIQAIEAYHRRAFHNHALDPEEHSRRVKLVTDSLARDDRVSDIEKAWVESKIRYNEPSLVERLTQLYDKLPSKAQGVLGGRERFARTVADTRHYMTHWDERQRARALTGAELLLGIQQLRLVIKLVFLGELGLATDEMIGRLREPRHIEKLLR